MKRDRGNVDLRQGVPSLSIEAQSYFHGGSQMEVLLGNKKVI